MSQNVEQFLYVLPYIGKGMLGIFVVTAAIVLSIMVLNRISAMIKKED